MLHIVLYIRTLLYYIYISCVHYNVQCRLYMFTLWLFLIEHISWYICVRYDCIFLQIFSRFTEHPNVCLSHLATSQRFRDGSLGLSYVASPMYYNPGGICSRGTHFIVLFNITVLFSACIYISTVFHQNVTPGHIGCVFLALP